MICRKISRRLRMMENDYFRSQDMSPFLNKKNEILFIELNLDMKTCIFYDHEDFKIRWVMKRPLHIRVSIDKSSDRLCVRAPSTLRLWIFFSSKLIPNFSWSIFRIHIVEISCIIKCGGDLSFFIVIINWSWYHEDIRLRNEILSYSR